MATTDQNVPLWPYIEASWTTPSSEWQKLESCSELLTLEMPMLAVTNDADLDVTPDESNDASGGPQVMHIRTIFALSQNKAREPRYAELSVARPPNVDLLHWHLIIKKMPDSSPPELIAASSKVIGGFDGAVKLLQDVVDSAAPLARFVAIYEVDAKETLCRVLDKTPQQLVGSDSNCSLRNVNYQVEDSQNGLREIFISYQPETDLYVVKLTLRSPLRVDEDCWFPQIGTVCSETQSSLFDSREMADGINR